MKRPASACAALWFRASRGLLAGVVALSLALGEGCGGVKPGKSRAGRPRTASSIKLRQSGAQVLPPPPRVALGVSLPAQMPVTSWGT